MNGFLNCVVREVATLDQVVYIISCQGHCAHKELLYPEFRFTVTDFASRTIKMSDRGDNITEGNLQADGLRKSQPKGQWKGGKWRKGTVPP